MKKYQILELIGELFRDRNEIRSTSIDYKQTKDKSSSMTIITRDEDLFEIKIRRM